ncbi:MAG: hypothetical protein CR993_02130 [Rhodobacterales bacterium]|nr:MAG: hypothetical protein CR993_02130 [Rhodobacterales bacterium]
MRAVALIALLASPAAADTDLLAKYRSGIDACYQRASDAQAILACDGELASPCMEREPGGMSTHGMIGCIDAETRFWDEKLNAEYRVTMREMRELDAVEAPGTASREDALREAQRAWIPFRDANCAFDYILWGPGSMRGIAGASCLSSMTAQRTVDLISIRETFK